MSIITAVIDWETLGLANDTQVISVGMTAFDLTVESTIGELRRTTWSTNISLVDQQERSVNPSTVEWWAKQSQEAQDAVQADPKLTLEKALEGILKFCLKHKIDVLVGNGENFDNAILKNICEHYDAEYPVPFWGDADLRTMKMMAGLKGSKSKFPPQLTPHVAADDAIFEAMVAQTCYRKCYEGRSES